LHRIGVAEIKAKAKGGLSGLLTRGGCAVGAAVTFLGLLLVPVIPNELPDEMRVQPVW
jgi:magnesium-protoporphyrin IX monomethyl ester (oxidative) cyclase